MWLLNSKPKSAKTEKKVEDENEDGFGAFEDFVDDRHIGVDSQTKSEDEHLNISAPYHPSLRCLQCSRSYGCTTGPHSSTLLPKTLPCLHVICSQCVSSNIESAGCLECPFCFQRSEMFATDSLTQLSSDPLSLARLSEEVMRSSSSTSSSVSSSPVTSTALAHDTTDILVCSRCCAKSKEPSCDSSDVVGSSPDDSRVHIDTSVFRSSSSHHNAFRANPAGANSNTSTTTTTATATASTAATSTSASSWDGHNASGEKEVSEDSSNSVAFCLECQEVVCLKCAVFSVCRTHSMCSIEDSASRLRHEIQLHLMDLQPHIDYQLEIAQAASTHVDANHESCDDARAKVSSLFVDLMEVLLDRDRELQCQLDRECQVRSSLLRSDRQRILENTEHVVQAYKYARAIASDASDNSVLRSSKMVIHRLQQLARADLIPLSSELKEICSMDDDLTDEADVTSGGEAGAGAAAGSHVSRDRLMRHRREKLLMKLTPTKTTALIDKICLGGRSLVSSFANFVRTSTDGRHNPGGSHHSHDQQQTHFTSHHLDHNEYSDNRNHSTHFTLPPGSNFPPLRSPSLPTDLSMTCAEVVTSSKEEERDQHTTLPNNSPHLVFCIACIILIQFCHTVLLHRQKEAALSQVHALQQQQHVQYQQCLASMSVHNSTCTQPSFINNLAGSSSSGVGQGGPDVYLSAFFLILSASLGGLFVFDKLVENLFSYGLSVAVTCCCSTPMVTSKKESAIAVSEQ